MTSVGYIQREPSVRTAFPRWLDACFVSDDTGCPSSQCASPTKKQSSTDTSPVESPSPPPTAAQSPKVKRVKVNLMAKWRTPTQNPKQQHSLEQHRGSEVDFSSTSSTRSFKTRETSSSNSIEKKSSFSHGRVSHIRTRPVFKPPGSPTAPRDSDLYRTPPKSHLSSTTGSCSCPSGRRTTSGRYHSCSDNHGIRPPHPEQYLTPLQQKEVTIRHLKSELEDSKQIIGDRDSEIQDLKSQLDRMREDWIEEECHRVEAQLALKEARKEIKQLRRVVETMKSSLMEKDKGIQKYFIDINIQNRKLESLLHSMELAQNGSNLHEDSTLDFICDSPEKLSTDQIKQELQIKDQAQEMADSGLLINDDSANQTDISEKVLMSTAVDSSQFIIKLMNQSVPGVSTLAQSQFEDLADVSKVRMHAIEEKAVQTDELYSPDVQNLLLNILKLHNAGLSGLMSPASIFNQQFIQAQDPNISQENNQITKKVLLQVDMPSINTFDNPVPTRLVIPQDSGGSSQSSESGVNPGITRKQDTSGSTCTAVVGKGYWNNGFLVDLVAAATPVVPAVTWMYPHHGAVGGAPINNIAALIRGCCIVGLHSLRLVTYGPHF